MHYCVVVVIPKASAAIEQIDEQVEQVLAPYFEKTWDFWKIGGRWTGILDGYNPETDPENIERCDLCHATGRRNDAIGQQARKENPKYGCNGCDGKGKRVKWPTQWKSYPGDCQPVVKVLGRPKALARIYALVVDGEWIEMPQKAQSATVRKLLTGYREDVAVVVDCHN